MFVHPTRLFGTIAGTIAGSIVLAAFTLLVITTLLTGRTTAEEGGASALFQRLDANSDGEIGLDEVESSQRWLLDRLLRLADDDQSGTLSQAEFQRGLTPQSPQKPIVEKASARLPGADAAQVLLLKMDVDGNGLIEAKEVPVELLEVFDLMVEELDYNGDDRLTRQELGRGGPKLSRLAGRLARERDYDVQGELARLRRQQGAKADRFDMAPRAGDRMASPQAAADLFVELDANGDKQLELKEVPERYHPRFERLLRVADSNSDGQLSAKEFADGAKRASRLLKRFQNP